MLFVKLYLYPQTIHNFLNIRNQIREKKRRVLRNTYEQTGPLINHIAEIGTFAQVAKTIYSFLPKDIRK